MTKYRNEEEVKPFDLILTCYGNNLYPHIVYKVFDYDYLHIIWISNHGLAVLTDKLEKTKKQRVTSISNASRRIIKCTPDQLNSSELNIYNKMIEELEKHGISKIS